MAKEGAKLADADEEPAEKKDDAMLEHSGRGTPEGTAAAAAAAAACRGKMNGGGVIKEGES